MGECQRRGGVKGVNRKHGREAEKMAEEKTRKNEKKEKEKLRNEKKKIKK